jgi:hypothetical protein
MNEMSSLHSEITIGYLPQYMDAFNSKKTLLEEG